MIYLVRAFDHGDQQQVKKQEVTGIAAAQALEAKWEAQGYDVTTTMQCSKYIELMKLKDPAALKPREWVSNPHGRPRKAS
jgi:hypothetical protein